MSILLKGIEMPDCCMNCPLSVSVNFGLVCCPTSTILPDSKLFDDDGNALEKPSWCPIIEVPPHGRLIDANATYDSIAEVEHSGNYVDMDAVGRGIDDTPTVIPADNQGGDA